MRAHGIRHTSAFASQSLLCGIRDREENSITCQVDVCSDWSYELCVVPHWDPSAAMFERFDAPKPALLRQAEVARLLRANGCTVIEYGAVLGIHGAA
jgi:hypothetical protein